MIMMQIVIEIPKVQYENLAKIVNAGKEPLGYWERVVMRGTPLPKDHGDLKDMSNLKYVFDLTRDDPIYSGKDIEQAVKSMKTIVPEDKENQITRCGS